MSRESFSFLSYFIIQTVSADPALAAFSFYSNFYVVPTDNLLEVNLQYIYKFLYFALASLIANLMVGIGLSRSGCNLGKKLRNMAFSAMLERSLGWFDDTQNTTGDLTTILSADVEAVESLTGFPLGFRVRVLTSILTGVCVALAYSLEIGLVAIACVPIIMAAGFLQVCCAKRKVKSKIRGASPPTIMEQGAFQGNVTPIHESDRIVHEILLRMLPTTTHYFD